MLGHSRERWEKRECKCMMEKEYRETGRMKRTRKVRGKTVDMITERSRIKGGNCF